MQNTARLTRSRRSDAEPRSCVEPRSVLETAYFPTLPKPQLRLEDLAGRLSRTMAVAQALLQGGRTVDLTGMNEGIGVLCAQTLDQPLEEARTMLPVLHGVLERVDQLSLALHVAARPGSLASGAVC